MRTKRQPVQREADLQGQIVKALRWIGFWVEVNTSGHRGKGKVRAALGAGAPDLMVAIGDGRILWLETKAKGGILSSHQIEWHRKAASYGISTLVVDSVRTAIDIATSMRQSGAPHLVHKDIETAAWLLADIGYA